MEQQNILQNFQAKKLQKAFSKQPEVVYLLVNENAEQEVLLRQIKLIKKLSQKFDQQIRIKIGLYGINTFTGFMHQVVYNQKSKKFKIPDEIEDRLKNKTQDQPRSNQGWHVFEKLREELKNQQSQVQNLLFIVSNNLDNLFILQGDKEDQKQEYIENIEFVNDNCYMTFLLEVKDNIPIDYEGYEIKTSRIIKAQNYKYISEYIEKIAIIQNILPIEDFQFANRMLKLSFNKNGMTANFEIILTNIVNNIEYTYSTENESIEPQIELSIGNQKRAVIYIKRNCFGKYLLRYRTKLKNQTWSNFQQLEQVIDFNSIQPDIYIQIIEKDQQQIKAIVNNLQDELEKYTLPQEIIDLGITKINFAFFGEMSVGKSSTINTLINAVGGQCQQVVSNGDKSCTLKLQEITSFNNLKSFCAYDTAGFELQNKYDIDEELNDIMQTQYGNQTLKYLLQGRLQKNFNLTSKNTEALSNLRLSQLQNRIHAVILIVDISREPNIQLLNSFIQQLNNTDGAVYTPIVLLTKSDTILIAQIGNKSSYNMKDLYETYQMQFKSYYDNFINGITNEIKNIQKEYIFPFINYKSSNMFNQKEDDYQYDNLGELNIRSFLQNFWIVKVRKCNNISNKCIGYIKKTANTSSDQIDKITHDIKKLVQESKFLENVKTWSIITNNQSVFKGQIIQQDEINVKIGDILHDDQYIVINVNEKIEISDNKQLLTQNNSSNYSIENDKLKISGNGISMTTQLNLKDRADLKTQKEKANENKEISDIKQLQTQINSSNNSIKNVKLQSSCNGVLMAIYFNLEGRADLKTQKVKANENDTLDILRQIIQQECNLNLDQYGFPYLPIQVDEEKCSISEYFKTYFKNNYKQIEFCLSNVSVQVLFEQDYQKINLNKQAKYDLIKKTIIKRFTGLNDNNFGFFKIEGEIDEEDDLYCKDDFIRIDNIDIADVQNYGIEQLSSQNKKGDKGLVIFQI